ncbi:MAG: glycosyltransferase family 8 protein [Clostridia bacterium]|nr:glycosyltransferase family 8 protein [Clostridia bacterium]
MANNQIIPIFFSTDDNYVPFVDISIRSLIENASRDYKYKIMVLNTGLNKENTDKILKLSDENFEIEFVDVSPAIEGIKEKLKNIFHFGLATYYRLFIEQMFPEYDKILYLDCDIVVKGDISKLYFTDLEGNWIGGVVEQFILHTEEFSTYTREAVGIESKNYINAGIMIIDLAKFRENKIEDTFVELINKYNFETIDPDQAYINFLCRGHIKYLPVCWNRTPLEMIPCENPQIIHYALYKKPWQYDNVFLGEHFWEYAKKSPFYENILSIKENFDDEKKAKKEQAGIQIKLDALKIAESDNTFKKVLLGV